MQPRTALRPMRCAGILFIPARLRPHGICSAWPDLCGSLSLSRSLRFRSDSHRSAGDQRRDGPHQSDYALGVEVINFPRRQLGFCFVCLFVCFCLFVSFFWRMWCGEQNKKKEKKNLLLGSKKKGSSSEWKRIDIFVCFLFIEVMKYSSERVKGTFFISFHRM